MPGPVSDQMPTLSERMRIRAERDAEHREELLGLADALDAVANPLTPIPKLVGTWAKARRRWCEITGESLI